MALALKICLVFILRLVFPCIPRLRFYEKSAIVIREVLETSIEKSMNISECKLYILFYISTHKSRKI